MSTHTLLEPFLEYVPAVNRAITVSRHNIIFGRWDISLDRGVKKVRMLIPGYGLIHLHVNKMNDGPFRARNQRLVPIGQQVYTVDRIVDYAVYLCDWGLTLNHRVYPDAAVRMAWVDYGLYCVGGYVFDALSAAYWQGVWGFLYLPDLYLTVLWTAGAFLLVAWPCYRVYLLAVPDEGMKRFSCWCVVQCHCFVSSSCKKLLSSVV